MAGSSENKRKNWQSVSRAAYQESKHTERILPRATRLRNKIAAAMVDWDDVNAITEVGVGNGRFQREAASRGVMEQHAVDINSDFLDGVEHIATDTHEAGITELPIATDSQDCAVALGVLGHLPDATAAKAGLSELARVTDSGGQVVLMVGNDGVARRVRKGYQRARQLGKRVTGLGSEEDVYNPLGASAVTEMCADVGLSLESEQYITFTPGIVDSVEMPLERRLHRSLTNASRERLAQNTVLSLRVE